MHALQCNNHSQTVDTMGCLPAPYGYLGYLRGVERDISEMFGLFLEHFPKFVQNRTKIGQNRTKSLSIDYSYAVCGDEAKELPKLAQLYICHSCKCNRIPSWQKRRSRKLLKNRRIWYHGTRKRSSRYNKCVSVNLVKAVKVVQPAGPTANRSKIAFKSISLEIKREVKLRIVDE